MEFRLSMWNFHNWFQTRNISHFYSIRSNEACIRGVRMQVDTADLSPDYAYLIATPHASEYRAVLSYQDNQIYFHTLDVPEVMNEINYLFAIHFHWLQALRRINLNRGELSDLLALCNELMPYPILIFFGDQLLATSPYYQEESRELWQTFCDMPLCQMIDLLPLHAQHHALYEAATPVLTNSPLFQQRQVLISTLDSCPRIRLVAFASTQPLSPGHIHLMQELSKAVESNLQSHLRQLELRQCSPFLHFLSYSKTHTPNHAQLQRALRQLNWKPDSSFTVFRFELRTGSDSIILDKLFQTLKTAFPSAFWVLDSCAVLLLWNVTNDPAVPDQSVFSPLLAPRYFIIGQSNISTDFSLLPQLMQQAQQTLEKAKARNVFFLSTQEMISDYIHQALYHAPEVQSLVHPAIHRLMEIDMRQESGFCYLDTLKTYLHLGGNCNAVAKQLGIHRNTLMNRLRRIQECTGIDYANPQELESLYLSILISEPESCDPTS